MLAERGDIQPLVAPLLLDLHARDQPLHFLLHGCKADHGIQPLMRDFHRGRLGLLLGVDDGDGADIVHRIERGLRTLFGKPHEDEGEAKPGGKDAQNGQRSEDH